MATLDIEGAADKDALARQAADAGYPIVADDSWSDIFSRILTARVEPRLGLGRPVILDRYPRCEAALARATRDDQRLAERFELYLCGVELANGFGELTDAQEQRRRFEHEMDEKQRIYGESYPIDEDFLAALSDMPEASGVALGFDRLVMLATQAGRIDRVMWTPLSE
jgi:lysyl-tRNA synthetase class 2